MELWGHWKGLNGGVAILWRVGNGAEESGTELWKDGGMKTDSHLLD